jgi:hypothetical protein
MEMITLAGNVTAEQIGQSIGLPVLARGSAQFPIPARDYSLSEALTRVRARIYDGRIIDDYAVVELSLVRFGGSVGFGVDRQPVSTNFSLDYSSTLARILVDAIEGSSFRVGSDIAYFETRETQERTIIGERKTISTGVDIDIYFSRLDYRSGVVYGKFSVSSAGDSQASSVSRTDIPFRVFCVGSAQFPIVRLVVSSTTMAADLTKLTGRTILAGDTVEFRVRLR